MTVRDGTACRSRSDQLMVGRPFMACKSFAPLPRRVATPDPHRVATRRMPPNARGAGVETPVYHQSAATRPLTDAESCTITHGDLGKRFANKGQTHLRETTDGNHDRVEVPDC